VRPRGIAIAPTPLLFGCIALTMAIALVASASASAEVGQLRISRGFGVHYLPLYIMGEKALLQKRAVAAGLGDVKVEFLLIDGGNHINDAVLARSIDIASTGTGGFLTLWAKAKGNPNLEVIGLGGSASGGMTMTTRNPVIRSLRDVTEKDRIAVPGIKTSLGAIILQMAVAKEFGDAEYARLDHLTVSLPYPEAVAAMLSGRSEITAHVASAPFSYMELESPGIHKGLQLGRAVRPPHHHHGIHHPAVPRRQSEACGELRGGAAGGHRFHCGKQGGGGTDLR
jgi:sulfonate transport system substrate-binding protein